MVVVVLAAIEEEEDVTIFIIRTMAVQEVVVVTAAITTVIGLEVVVHIEDIAETAEKAVDRGLIIHHQLVVMAVICRVGKIQETDITVRYLLNIRKLLTILLIPKAW